MDGKENLKILLVDDDNDILDLLTTYLSSQNMDVQTAESGLEALEKLKAMEFELLISDLMMPEMNGLQLLKRVNKEYPNVASIMLTSMDESKTAIQAIQEGAHDYIIKPVDFSHLSVCIQNALAKQKLIKENKAYKEKLETMVQEQVEVIQKQRSQLMQADKLSSLGTLIAGICHEVNNPLSFIKSNVELLGLYFGGLQTVLKEYAEQNPHYKLKNMTMDEALKNVHGMLADSKIGVQKIKVIIDDIMGFSRKKSDEQMVFSIVESIESALNLARFIIKNKVKVETDFGAGPAKTFGHPHRMERVFLNIIYNSIYAMREKKEAKLEISVDIASASGGEGEKTVVKIKDNGRGMSQEVLEKIFEVYFTTKPLGEGTGLGLPISKDIIEGHGGTVEVESELNVGTTFLIRLPIAQ